MNARRLFHASTAAALALTVLLTVETSSPAVGGLMVVALAAMVAGAFTGWSSLDLAGAGLAMGAAVVAAGIGASTGVLVVSAPLLWVSVESAWRSHDLRSVGHGSASGGGVGSMVADPEVGRSWLAQTGAVALATGAFGLVVMALADQAPAGGLTFRVLGVVAVLALAAALVVLDLRPNRWGSAGSPVRERGSVGPEPRTGAPPRR